VKVHAAREQRPISDSRAVRPGLQLHYLEWGAEGPALFLLAGLGDAAYIFDEAAPVLAKRYHVFA